MRADSIPGRDASEWMVVSNSQFGRFAGLALLVALSWMRCAAQTEGAPSNSAADSVLGAPAAVHGVVRNALTGEPLPRTLVQVNGQSGMAVLTDGDGRFEIAGVPLGPGVFALTKPGFEDATAAPAGVELRDLRGYTHNVFVTAAMPELDFAMRPTNAIRGQIELATGEPAQNIRVTLLAKQIQHGRAMWRPGDAIGTNADGAFHFAHLGDGDYAVVAGPAPDSGELQMPPPTDVVQDVARNWYPRTFSPDTRDFTGAAKIHLSGGEQAEANLTMRLEAFHPVQASVLLPGMPGTSPEGISVQCEVVDPDAHHVPYPVWYDGKTRRVRALLPDGSYTLRISASRTEGPVIFDGPLIFNGPPRRQEGVMTGQADVTVAGHAVTKLRIPAGPAAPTSMQVVVSRSGTQTATQPGDGSSEVFVEISQAGQLTDGMSSMFAQGMMPGTLDTNPPSPGKYWVHTVVGGRGLCEESFTAGGANLGREPLIVGQGGATAPMTLTLRDDCASLKVSLPASAAGMAPGDEPEYTVYLVPDSDLTTGAQTRTFRASTMTEFTFDGLTPGSYHAYAFAAPVELEYHNREVLAALPGQAVTLEPGVTGKLELEAPAQ